MPGKVAKIGTFSDWVGLFNDWRKDIGIDSREIDAFHFDTLYGAIDTEEITTNRMTRVRTCCTKISMSYAPVAQLDRAPAF